MYSSDKQESLPDNSNVFGECCAKELWKNHSSWTWMLHHNNESAYTLHFVNSNLAKYHTPIVAQPLDSFRT
ncbi:hypothetical protein CEXT_806251 [Caerostris extrusa]|uniref:Uncharacterized protein n=1 Tax=Caerostris extrusa TaxID=172846 RepID=A0AAV4MVL9_CAEEX|nr:hypothetical protein CEXT_806251 [Caerostris extrusa]